MVFEGCGNVTNAGKQTLAVVRYVQIVKRLSDGEIFHDQTDYWTWNPKNKEVMYSLTIPRGVALLAGGKAKREGDNKVLRVQAALKDKDWGITQSPFMLDKATTKAFELELTVEGDSLHYAQTTVLDIYGNEFEHTDQNTLSRVK